MTPNEERTLQETDRAAWVAYVAPSMANGIALMDDDGVNRSWSAMGRDYKAAVWELLDETNKARITRLRAPKNVKRGRA